MRKLLLASAAMLGATSGIISAHAQSSSTQQPAVSGPQALQGAVAAPWFAGNSYNNQNNSLAQISTYRGNVVGLGADSAPLPGTVVIHLHGRVEFDVMGSSSTGNTYLTTGGGASTTGYIKLNPVSMGAYLRLYPGVDGMATNGLRYGAQMEIRENFPSSGAAPYPSQNPAPGPSVYSSSETLFVRRAYAYISADNIGLMRFGQADGVIGLFDPCIFSSACWDGGVGVFQAVLGGLGASTNEGLAGSYAWLSQNGAEYGNTKITYLSPQIAGFELGFQYAPNMGNSFGGCGTNQATATAANTGATAGGAAPLAANNVGAVSGCIGTTTGTDPTRWYNQVGVGVRYQGIFGPISLGVYGFYETAGKEQPFSGATASGITGTPGHFAATAGNAYDNLSFVSAATYVKFASPVGIFTGAVDYIGGAVNGTLAMRPTGGAPEEGLMPGLMYQNGPITLGTSVMILDSQGAANLVGVSQRHEFGWAAGGNYNVAPGLYLVGEYQYETRHQGGYDFSANAVSPISATTGHAGLTRDVKSQAIFGSVVMTW